MKKFLSAILTVTILLGCFVFSVSAEGETSSITDNLVVAYDFEGNTQTYQLSDKATAGTVDNALAVKGTVTIKDGFATVAPNKASYLSLTGGADTANMGEYTIYMKVKFAGTYGSNWVNIFDGGKALKFIVNSDNSMQIRMNSEYAKRQDIANVVQDQWTYYAITVKLDGTKMYLNRYESADGVSFGTPVASNWNFTTTELSLSDVSLGACVDDYDTMSVSYDDIMIFNKALSADEVKEISTIKFDIKSNLVAAYDFEGNTQTYQLSDKATAGSINDALSVGGAMNVTVANGVATISNANLTNDSADTEVSKLTFKGSADLQNMSEYTLYMKVKHSGTANAWSSYINAPGMVRWLFTSGNTNSLIRINCKDKYQTSFTVTPSEWIYVAMSVKTDGEKIYLDRYYSADGKTYGDAAHSQWDIDSSTFGGKFNIGSSNVVDIGWSKGMDMSFDDIMIFNKALSAGEVAELSTVKVSQDRLGFVGYQTGNETSTSYDIRFVSVIDSLNYDSVGYDVVVTKNGVEQGKVTYYCEKVYGKILELGFEKTSAQLGGKYIFAFGITGFDVMDGDVVFTVTPFYYDGEKKPLTTVEITNPTSETGTCKFVYGGES